MKSNNENEVQDARINFWGTMKLFAGWLQLLTLVHYSIQVYWSNIFILPNQVIKLIEHLFSRFLWGSRELRIRHIWNLFALVGSIWVAWINENLLRGRSFWVTKISIKCSWGWRKLLKLRELITQFIRSSLGDEKKKKNYGWIGGILMTFFTPATSYGYRVVYDAASSIKAKVSSVLN